MNNSGIEKKIELRKHFLGKKDNVLDMCCGDGVMYRECYKGKCASYMGLDLLGGRFAQNVLKYDSIDFVNKNGLYGCNFIDIDPWGCFNQFYNTVMLAEKKDALKIICTDGGYYSAQKKGFSKQNYKSSLYKYCLEKAKEQGYTLDDYICLNEQKMFYFGFFIRRLS